MGRDSESGDGVGVLFFFVFFSFCFVGAVVLLLYMGDCGRMISLIFLRVSTSEVSVPSRCLLDLA